jgi:hypothetical protein
VEGLPELTDPELWVGEIRFYACQTGLQCLFGLYNGEETRQERWFISGVE